MPQKKAECGIFLIGMLLMSVFTEIYKIKS